MSNTSRSKTPTKTEQSGQSFDDKHRPYFEKIMSNSEEIGKMKMEPFNVKTLERVRAFYRENEKLFRELMELK